MTGDHLLALRWYGRGSRWRWYDRVPVCRREATPRCVVSMKVARSPPVVKTLLVHVWPCVSAYDLCIRPHPRTFACPNFSVPPYHVRFLSFALIPGPNTTFYYQDYDTNSSPLYNPAVTHYYRQSPTIQPNSGLHPQSPIVIHGRHSNALVPTEYVTFSDLPVPSFVITAALVFYRSDVSFAVRFSPGIWAFQNPSADFLEQCYGGNH